MPLDKDIKDLLALVPKDTNPQQVLRDSDSQPSVVTLSGSLVGEEGDSILLQLGVVQLKIGKHDVQAITKSASEPAVGKVGVYVDLQVSPDAIIFEIRKKVASEYGPHAGQRPFVHELPSAAMQHAISAEDFDRQQAAWRESVGLEDFAVHEPMGTSTPYLTQSSTPFNTSYTTLQQTSTPGDTQTDRPLDYKTDSKADFQTDYKWDANPALAESSAELMSTPSPYLTQGPTATQTPYTTVQQTTTPGDTTSDRPLDYKSDSQTDFSTDYKTDY